MRILRNIVIHANERHLHEGIYNGKPYKKKYLQYGKSNHKGRAIENLNSILNVIYL